MSQGRAVGLRERQLIVQLKEHFDQERFQGPFVSTEDPAGRVAKALGIGKRVVKEIATGAGFPGIQDGRGKRETFATQLLAFGFGRPLQTLDQRFQAADGSIRAGAAQDVEMFRPRPVGSRPDAPSGPGGRTSDPRTGSSHRFRPSRSRRLFRRSRPCLRRRTTGSGARGRMSTRGNRLRPIRFARA